VNYMHLNLSYGLKARGSENKLKHGNTECFTQLLSVVAVNNVAHLPTDSQIHVNSMEPCPIYEGNSH
jgi:hypothetical protein